MKPKIRCLVAILLTCHCHATSVIFVVISQGIFAAVDGYSTTPSPSEPSLLRVDKTAIIQNRLIIIGLGAADIDIGGANGFPRFTYHFTKWIPEIKKKCPQNVSVSALTTLIEKESGIAFNNLDRYIAAGALDSFKPRSNLLQYAIAGYDARVPTINIVKFDFDWQNRRLAGPMVATIHPNPNGRVDSGLYFGGMSIIQPSELQNRESKSYKELAPLIPKELPRILTGQDFTDREAKRICLSILRVDAKYFPRAVGPPYIITKLVPLGMGTAAPVVYKH